MFKALLIETLPPKCDLKKLAQASGIAENLIAQMLDDNDSTEPSRAEYAAIIKAIPVSVCAEIAGLAVPEEVKDDLDYLGCQMQLMEQSADDRYQPMFSGMQRVLRRITGNLG